MVTPDKDYAQLVDNNTFMLKPARGGKEEELLNENDILKQWNIKDIHQVIDILGLAGDSVDISPKDDDELLLNTEANGSIAPTELFGASKAKKEKDQQTRSYQICRKFDSYLAPLGNMET